MLHSPAHGDPHIGRSFRRDQAFLLAAGACTLTNLIADMRIMFFVTNRARAINRRYLSGQVPPSRPSNHFILQRRLGHTGVTDQVLLTTRQRFYIQAIHHMEYVGSA